MVDLKNTPVNARSGKRVFPYVLYWEKGGILKPKGYHPTWGTETRGEKRDLEKDWGKKRESLQRLERKGEHFYKGEGSRS